MREALNANAHAAVAQPPHLLDATGISTIRLPGSHLNQIHKTLIGAQWIANAHRSSGTAAPERTASFPRPPHAGMLDGTAALDRRAVPEHEQLARYMTQQVATKIRTTDSRK
jgi:hypothetical protein